MDVVREIQRYNAGREPERLQLKYRAMRASSFGFLRGSCHLFYGRLPGLGALKAVPRVWVCGDLHLQNFGCYKGDNRLAYFDINDFDEAALAPASWDLLRLVSSLLVAAQELGLSQAQATGLGQELLEAYGSALNQGKALWLEHETCQGPVRELLGSLRDRERAKFLDVRSRLSGKKRKLLIDGKHALATLSTERAKVLAFMHDFAAAQSQPDFYQVIDVARRVAGTGSLGLARYAILVQGKGSPHGNYLLDLKQAQSSSLLAHLDVPQPRWKTQAHRTVALQQRLQAVPMAFLQPVRFEARPFVLRALQPTEDRLTLGRHLHPETDWRPIVRTMGQLVAWAQLRSAGREGSAIADELIEFGLRRKWRARLLALAQECATQIGKDARLFNAAFDDGAFHG